MFDGGTLRSHYAPLGLTHTTQLLKLTLTRFTVLFLLLNFIPCIAEGLIQAFLYQDDANAATFVSEILQAGKVSTRYLPWLKKNDNGYQLDLCDHVPSSQTPGSTPVCVPVFANGNPDLANILLPAGFRRSDDVGPIAEEFLRGQGVNLTLTTNQSGTPQGVNMTYDSGNRSVFLDEQCTMVLLYPMQVFRNSRTESLALVGLQFWLLVMSIFALLTESIPHVIALLFMRVLSVSWSSYTIWRTLDIQRRLDHLVSDPNDSACRFDLFHGYIPFRIALQVPDLVISCLALFITGYLGWRLIRSFNEHTFKRVGPPPDVVRLYRYMLTVCVCLHMCLYLTVTSMGLWAEQLLHSAVAAISSHTRVYLALFVFIIVTLLPWIYMGIYAIKREKKLFMLTFVLLSATYVVSWSLMFDSEVYRWTWTQWPFFASCTISAFIGLIASGVFGVVCWTKFGAGLAHYLYVEELLAKSDFEPDAFKVDTGQPSPRTPLADVRKDAKRPLSMFTKDTNWDIADPEAERPPIYIVELSDPGRRGPPPFQPWRIEEEV
ncbi:hypothetical protein NM688_g5893 [Phlebia brevispora]|uniref:Uncharacterized protein n=1 Tax=Phlebia brevispora TaxID=194682 RepID=A0ACC1SNK8_9APHY|nr:hypothetical protein NM688_g5893 [Phlebia brevispora]